MQDRRGSHEVEPHQDPETAKSFTASYSSAIERPVEHGLCRRDDTQIEKCTEFMFGRTFPGLIRTSYLPSPRNPIDLLSSEYPSTEVEGSWWGRRS